MEHNIVLGRLDKAQMYRNKYIAKGGVIAEPPKKEKAKKE